MDEMRMRRCGLGGWLCACIAVATMCAARLDVRAAQDAAPAAPQRDVAWKEASERWYVLEIADAPAGWMREFVETDGERFRTSTETHFAMKRGPIEMNIAMQTHWLESIDGAPLELRSVQDMSRQKVEATMIFHDDHIEHVSRQGGRELRERFDLPEQAFLTPQAVQRLWVMRLNAAADEVHYAMITGETGASPIVMTHKRLRSDEYTFAGRSYPVTVWESTNSLYPTIKSTTWMSSDGRLMFDEMQMPFGKMATKLATKEQATRAIDGGGPELMFNSFVSPDKPVSNARAATKSVLRLRTKQGAMPELPSAGAQGVQRGEDERTIVLNIDINDNQPASGEDKANKEYLEPSAAIDSTDKMIIALAKRATKNAGDEPFKRAEALRSFVHKHIDQKALDTAFASASEVARLRTGDCSEHGVLLCALLRADGIPARIAGGLVYADQFAGTENIFGWHMWTQALIGEEWVDYDATLPVRYDAMHVLTTADSMAQGSLTDSMSSMIQLFGNLEIEVVEVGYERSDDATE